METLTLTSELQVQLTQLKTKTELRDADGNTVGVFTPNEQIEAELYEKAKKMVDPTLIEHRKKEKGALPFEEVKKRISTPEAAE